MVFLTGEHSNNKTVPISVHYFSSSRCMPIFISVGKVVLLVCIKSSLIISFPARTINKTPHNLLGENLSFKNYQGGGCHLRTLFCKIVYFKSYCTSKLKETNECLLTSGYFQFLRDLRGHNSLNFKITNWTLHSHLPDIGLSGFFFRNRNHLSPPHHIWS